MSGSNSPSSTNRPPGQLTQLLGRVGLGTAALGDLYAQVPDKDALDTVHTALAAGIRYVDTAPHYALGVAEQRLGRALRDVPRESYLLSTKVGRLLVPGESQPGWLPALRREWDFSAGGVRRSLEQSMARLGVDRIDVVYIHDPESHVAQALDEALPALVELRDAGVIRAIGVGSGDVAALSTFVASGQLDLTLVAGRYTLLDQSALPDLLPSCERHGTGVVLGGVYNSGVLADATAHARFDYRPAPAALLARARAMAAVCERHGTTLRAAALRFPFGHPAVGCVLIGPADVAQLQDNLVEFARPVPVALWAELKAQGLLPADVPIPAETSAVAGSGR